jgi:hypothetical protein
MILIARIGSSSSLDLAFGIRLRNGAFARERLRFTLVAAILCLCFVTHMAFVLPGAASSEASQFKAERTSATS